MEIIKEMITSLLIHLAIQWIIGVVIVGIISFFVIRAICNYQAKQNAKQFNYDYLAEKTAKEVCKRMILIEKQKQENKKTDIDETKNKKGSSHEPGTLPG